MPIEKVTAYRDSYGDVHVTLLNAQIEEVMGVYYGERPPSDEELDSDHANELTRWAAQVVIEKLPQIIETIYGEGARIITGEQVENMQQVMTQTQPSHEVRMKKALSALGFDCGDSEELPDSYINVMKAEVLKAFYLDHFKGYSCTTPENELNPDDVGNDVYAYGYAAGVDSMIDEIKRAVETDLEGLGSKL